jgi:hypothetical protein
MNKYRKWYNNLMEKAQNREPLTGYTEKHHILPKCMGGSNHSSNIVILTAREHFLAHIMLAKMDLSKKDHIKMLHAAYAMANKYTQIPHKREYNSKIYETLKKERQELMRGEWLGDKNPSRNLSPEKEQIKRKKLSDISLNLHKDAEYRKRFMDGRKKLFTPEYNKKIAETTKAAMWRPEVRQKYLEGVEKRDEHTRRVFSVRSPDGTIHHAKGITAFAREHGLHTSCLKNLLDNKYKQHKGWTRV